ncbi:MAG: hypothetical protein ACI4DU_07360 [Lachnospiraceae bacterium]
MRDGNLLTGLRKWINIGIALGITVVLFTLLFLYFDVLYYANDDVMIQDILSGRFSGQSSSMTVYFNQPLSFLLSGFYRLQPSIPWFGIFQIGCYGLCLTMVLAKLISGEDKWWKKAICVMGVIVLFLMLFGRQMILPTYTVTAAVVGATAIFCVAYCKENRFPWESLLLTILCYEIRSNVCYLMLPFLAVAVCYHLLTHERPKKKKMILQAGVFVSCLVLLVLLQLAFYNGKDWKDYFAYNDLRTLIYDYTGIAMDENAVKYYEECGLSGQTIDCYQKYDILLADDISSYPLEVFRDYQEQLPVDQKQKCREAVYVYVHRLFLETEDMPYNILLIFLYVLLIFDASLFPDSKKQNSAAHTTADLEPAKPLRKIGNPLSLLLFLLFVGRSVIWIYLIYRGRYPERITVSLYLFEILLLLGMWQSRRKSHQREGSDRDSRNWRVKFFGIFSGVLLVGISLYGSVYSMQSLCKSYQVQISVNEKYDMVYFYMEQHPDDFFLLDVNSFPNRTEYALKSDTYGYHNYMLLGGWMMGHPLLEQKLEREQIGNVRVALYGGNSVYFIGKDLSLFEGENVEILETFTVGEEYYYLITISELACRTGV